MLEVIEVNGKQGLQQFIDVAHTIYRNDSNWVPPLKFSLMNTLQGKDSSLLANGPHSFFLARDGDHILGRICTGIDEKLNCAKDSQEGYITLFECINSFPAAAALFDRAAQWLQERGMCMMKGPVSYTDGDDYRGLLVEGFDGPPVLMNPYNPDYYPDLFEKYGFKKHTDLYAFHVDLKQYNEQLYRQFISRAMKRFAVNIDRISFFKTNRDVADIKEILDIALPREWPDLIPPSLEEIQQMVRKLRWVALRDGILIARSNGRPVGFVIGLPDYNQAIKPMQGQLLPFGIFRFLRYKRKINSGRISALFVIPAFRRKVVAEALFCSLISAAKKRGYIEAEGSTIGEENRVMLQTVQAMGGRQYRTYRIYKKEL